MYRVVRKDNQDVTLFSLNSNSKSVKIGRDARSCGIKLELNAAGVSREHVELKWQRGGVVLVDTSSYGTIVDGEKIVKGELLLKGGEEVIVGQTLFVLIKEEQRRNVAPLFNKNGNVLIDDSSSESFRPGRVLASETADSQSESMGASRIDRTLPHRSSQRVKNQAVRKKNPLIDDEVEEVTVVSSRKTAVLALETQNDSGRDPFLRPSVPSASIRTQPVDLPAPSDISRGGVKKKSLFFGRKSRASPLVSSSRPNLPPTSPSLPPPLSIHPLSNQPIQITIADEEERGNDMEVEEERSVPSVKRRKTSDGSGVGVGISPPIPLHGSRSSSRNSNDKDMADEQSQMSVSRVPSFNRVPVHFGKMEAEKEESPPFYDDLILDQKTQSQLVEFSDSLVRSQDVTQMNYSASLIPRGTGGFKKFRKARQGRFYSARSAAAATIGGSADLVDFRQISI